MTPITPDELIKSGYEKRTFFFAIGGGEDEDDQEIFVKGGIAITYESTFSCWCARPEREINYVDGFNVDDATKVENMEELNQLKQ
jgi:hypothetical protein